MSSETDNSRGDISFNSLNCSRDISLWEDELDTEPIIGNLKLGLSNRKRSVRRNRSSDTIKTEDIPDISSPSFKFDTFTVLEDTSDDTNDKYCFKPVMEVYKLTNPTPSPSPSDPN